MTDLKLTPIQQTLYDLLERNGDVSFVDIYLAVGGDPEKANDTDPSTRHYAQSWISSYIIRLNRRLKAHGQRVVPGRVKRTYCLSRNV